ncbi:hypothetical protein ACFL2Z_01130 [Candidatus Eisenbacteria bacterium]|uniref:Bacterial surface antigen (D15) domain-containing protein n=1 Tax=Eiseniibacteriota bacterium TaxID=2212470 RepID=A0ABV6YN52_UNCEI
MLSKTAMAKTLHHMIPIFGLALVLLSGGIALGQVPSLQPAGLDTVRVEAGCTVILPDTTFIVESETVLLLPHGTECVVRTPSDMKSDAFYNSLQSQSEKGTVRKALFGAMLRESNQAGPTTEIVKSETPFVPFDGMIIRSVHLIKVDTWAGSVEDTTIAGTTGFSKTINSLHTHTRDEVLEKNLRFAEGDSLDPFVIADNERLLRNLPYIEDARIYLAPSVEDSQSVDVIVVTKDLFPWGLSGSINSANSFYVRPFNRNVAGLGHEISYRYFYDDRQSPPSGHEIKYFIENIGSSFTSGQVLYKNTWDIEELRLTLSKRFLTPQTRVGWGADIGVVRTMREEKQDGAVVDVPYEYNLQDVWLGRSVVVGDPAERRNVVFALRYRRDEFVNRPEVGPDSNQFYHHERLGLARLTFLRVNYLKTSLLRAFGIAEDVPYGYVASITSGMMDKEFKNRPYVGVEIGLGKYRPRFGYLSVGAGYGGYLDDQAVEEGVFTAEAMYFSDLATRGRYHFRQLARLVYTVGIDQLYYETIDIDEQIRGLSGAKISQGYLALNLESVAFTPWDWYRFRFAFYGYTDVGFINLDRRTINNSNFYGTLGIGCRIRNESLVLSTFNIQVGYLLRRPEGADPWYIETSTENPNRWYPISITKPDVIRFR